MQTTKLLKMPQRLNLSNCASHQHCGLEKIENLDPNEKVRYNGLLTLILGCMFTYRKKTNAWSSTGKDIRNKSWALGTLYLGGSLLHETIQSLESRCISRE